MRRLVVKQRPPSALSMEPSSAPVAGVAVIDESSPAPAVSNLPAAAIDIGKARSDMAMSSASTLVDDNEALKDAMEQCVLVSEADNVRSLRNFFDFATMLDAPRRYNSGTLELVAARVALQFQSLVAEVGEPRALAVYSSISGILQKVPSQDVFLPTQAFVAALFYLGWELAGSWEGNEPAIIRSAPRQQVVDAVYTLMSYMMRADVAQ